MMGLEEVTHASMKIWRASFNQTVSLGLYIANMNCNSYFCWPVCVHRPTAACRLGRTVTVVLRCTLNEQDPVTADLPPKCGDGTCDGCNFIFMIKSPLACPICKQEDIETFMTPCVDGKRSTIKKMKL